MRKVDRGNYSANKIEAYNDYPHPIGFNATISAPHMHAMCLELLENNVIKPGSRVLDVGSGSGYLTACFARMMGPTGYVIGIDVVPQLVELSIQNMSKADKDLLESGKVTLKVGDGWKGDPENAPFDAIHVGAAAESLPKELINQLAPNGRMIIPIGTNYQKLIQVDKNEKGLIKEREIIDVRYVPLVKI